MNPTGQTRSTLDTPAQYVKGVGPRRAASLAKLGIQKVVDLLYHVPRRYVDRSSIADIRDLTVGEHQTIIGKAVTHGIYRRKSGEPVFHLVVTDGTGVITCKWFNQPYLAKVFKTGEEYAFSGEVSHFRGLQMLHPEYEKSRELDQLLHTGRVVPVYALTEGISQKQMRRIMSNALDLALPVLKETLPDELLKRKGLPGLTEAMREVHFPPTQEEGERARRRIAFEELFYLELLLAMRKSKLTAPRVGVQYTGEGLLARRLMDRLDFELTGAQKIALADIEGDMRGDLRMGRLLQGDVGSGKTIVAVLAMLHAVESGFQAALMAPTEILAEQHFAVISELLRGMDLNVVLLLGKMTKTEKESAYHLLKSGEGNVAVGTHALLEESVHFKSLALVVVDEQHRFGVLQRAKLRKKGFNPDFLVMTATPIPRTLSLTLYGDLDVSVIDELPPGRKKVITRVVGEGKRERVYNFIREEVSKGRQCYVVCPIIEESLALDLKAAEDEYKRLSEEVFKDLCVGLLHGKMKSVEKETAMREFREGRADILVSTTVIEVGVDIPNATVMVIEHAERFGLAQLHQLRGRIGRGGDRSVCVLMPGAGVSREASERLKALAGTTDGFRIAELDMRMRGPGELFGTRQHGLPELRTADLLGDSRILVSAREEAFKVFDEDPQLLKDKNRRIRDAFLTKYKETLELAEVG